MNFLFLTKIKELLAKLEKKNREFAQFFSPVVLKKTVVTIAQRVQFVAHSPVTCDPIYLSKNKNQTDPRLSHPGNGRLTKI